MEEMAGLCADLEAIRIKHKIHIILLAHAHVKSFNDPNGPAYDKYELRMNAKVAAVWSAWADCQLFACFEATVKGGKRGKELEDAMAKGKATAIRRVIFTTRDAAYDAKNRYSLPEELPMSWKAFAEAIGWARREVVLLPPKTPPTAKEITAVVLERLKEHNCTEQEAQTITSRLVAAPAFKGDMSAIYKSASSGISLAKLAEKLVEVRGASAK